MKYVNGNILCLEEVDAVESGLSIAAIRKAKLRNSPSWKFHEHPEDKRKILFEYEKLKDTDKQKVKARFGNPFEYMAKMPIRNLIKWDTKAEEFYLAYRYDENKSLPIEHVNKYTIAASWLNMFKAVTEDKKALKKLLNLKIEEFYTHAIEIISNDKIDLPTLIESMQDEAEKFYAKGNSAAGTRLRKSMQDLKILAQEIRQEVQDLKNKEAK